MTPMKLRVGALRLRLGLGAITPEEIETHLAQIEHEIDATAALAHDVQAKEARSPECGNPSGAELCEPHPDRR